MSTVTGPFQLARIDKEARIANDGLVLRHTNSGQDFSVSYLI